MRARFCFCGLSFLLSLCVVPNLFGAEASYERTDEVIYGRKHGMALTMDVFVPSEKQNGAGIIMVASGGWYSSRAGIFVQAARVYLDRGYVVFGVVHGSQPKFSIPEIVGDMHRAVRFIRTNASSYKVDPNRLGITGGSAGGHLSLMQGTAGDAGNPEAKDPVDRVSSRVQAVACFFPPTDFLNYGKPGEKALGDGILENYKAPFDFSSFDETASRYERINDEEKRVAIGREISPVYHVTKDDPPSLIIHGDADKLVPIQQARLIIDRLTELKVPAKLVVKQGAEHGWPTIVDDVRILADWFDQHLVKGNDPATNTDSK
jgi:acetyl esterase/lipase